MFVAFAAAVAFAIAALSSKFSDCFSYSRGVILARFWAGCSGSNSGGGAGVGGRGILEGCILVKLVPVVPGAGAALSTAACEALGKGMLSKEGVELTMCAVFTMFLTEGKEGRSWWGMLVTMG